MSGETNGVFPKSPENMERRTEYPKPQRHYPNFSLRDRVYVVTGGGRGLGLVIAEAIVEAGADGMCILITNPYGWELAFLSRLLTM